MASLLHFGAAYSPEHWTPGPWDKDIRLMKEAGFTVIRMAEFAWSMMEPAEGQFNFDWLEQVISIDETGWRVQHGNRCHYCVNFPASRNPLHPAE